MPFDIFSRFSTLSKASCLCIVSDGASWGPMGTDSRDSKALPGACDECPSYPHEALCEALSAFQVLTCLSLGLRDTYTEETCDNKPHHRCANAKLRCTQAPSPSLDRLTGRRKCSPPVSIQKQSFLRVLWRYMLGLLSEYQPPTQHIGMACSMACSMHPERCTPINTMCRVIHRGKSCQR